MTMSTLRAIMAVAAASLLIAAVLQAGILIRGPFDQAALYETSIALILGIGLALTFIGPRAAQRAAVAAQAIALAGACVGLYLSVRGIGPNTVVDILYHLGLIGLLVVSLAVAWRLRATRSPSEGRSHEPGVAMTDSNSRFV
jgi:hypothetical protein